jgi:transposase
VSEIALHQVVKTNTNTHSIMTTKIAIKAKTIKLGIDVHADSYRVVRQIDHATPQPAQKFTPQEFIPWVKKQLEQAEAVHTCYEAGPFGYGLHRTLLGLGIKNVVVRPQNWDELHKGVKTDKFDALALTQRLDRYVQGNLNALAIVRVPTPAQELARSQSRQREQLLRHRLRLEAQGRSLMLFNGLRVKGRWWQALHWLELQRRVPEALLELLKVIRDLLVAVQSQLNKASKRLEEAASKQPKGVGALTSQIVEREILSWDRFNNRRQVASLTGMCPGVRASGNKLQSGSITKAGNRRLRTALVELAWRWVRFQPDYKPVKKCYALLADSKASSAAKKRAIVAVGRHVAIDLWRLNTGRTTLEKLSLR